MADITKCANTSCTIKENCYRFTAKASEYQSYWMFLPIWDKCHAMIDKDTRRRACPFCWSMEHSDCEDSLD